jgi:hypothetical protein
VLLTDRLPFTGQTRDEIARQIHDVEPSCPRKLRRRLDRELEVITLKCLEKGPARRYASAVDLADDLGRWLRDEPIIARVPSGFKRPANHAPLSTRRVGPRAAPETAAYQVLDFTPLVAYNV